MAEPLIPAADEAQSRAWLRPFVEFLNAKRLIGHENLQKLLKFHSLLDRRFGQLSLLKGFLALKDLFAILCTQAAEPLRFGGIAVREKLLTPEQVQEILDLQQNPFRLFLESLTSLNVFTPKQIADVLPEFRKSPHLLLAPPPAPSAAAPPFDRERISKIVGEITTLGSLHPVVKKVIALCQDPRTEIRQLSEVVKADYALTAQMLRMANSAALGGVRTISSLPEAASRLGMRGIRDAAVALATVGKFKKGDAAALKTVWAHGVLASQWALALGRTRGLKEEENVFVAGLVHDLGRAVIHQTFLPQAAAIARLVEQGKPTGEAEVEILGYTHAEIGAQLCHAWAFPDDLVKAVAGHHAPPEAAAQMSPLGAIVHAACRLAEVPFTAGDDAKNSELLGGLDPGFVQVHKIDATILDRLHEVHEKAREIVGLLT